MKSRYTPRCSFVRIKLTRIRHSIIVCFSDVIERFRLRSRQLIKQYVSICQQTNDFQPLRWSIVPRFTQSVTRLGRFVSARSMFADFMIKSFRRKLEDCYNIWKKKHVFDGFYFFGNNR